MLPLGKSSIVYISYIYNVKQWSEISPCEQFMLHIKFPIKIRQKFAGSWRQDFADFWRRGNILPCWLLWVKHKNRHTHAHTHTHTHVQVQCAQPDPNVTRFLSRSLQFRRALVISAHHRCTLSSAHGCCKWRLKIKLKTYFLKLIKSTHHFLRFTKGNMCQWKKLYSH